MTSPPLGTVDRQAGAVHLERHLVASATRVWDALTDPDRLGTWLGPVEAGRPGPGATFVVRMDDTETATCTVTTWDPPHRLELTWDYTGEGPSQLRIALADTEDGCRLVLDHVRLDVDPVSYGAGWHAHLDELAAVLETEGTAVVTATGGPDRTRFAAAYADLFPRYAAVATDAAAAEEVRS